MSTFARAAVRRVTGPRVYLRRGYRVSITPTDEALPVGGPVVSASVVALRSAQRFRAVMFESRVFVLDQLLVGDHYLRELRRLRDRIEARASDRRLHVLDCGANVGLFTLCSRFVLRPRVRVVGFEPFHENRLLCERNWKGSCDLVVRPEALADVDQQGIPLYVRSTTGATIVEEEAAGFDVAPVQVDTARLDALWPQLGLPRADLVKLDIEGAEEAALAGAAETIARDRPFVICSYEHPTNHPERLVELLDAIGGYTHADDPIRRLLTFEPPA
jgi:FkbM family methyltransferase